jgi:hypothetical protein
MPAIPTTRRTAKPVVRYATWHITSSGLETTITVEFGAYRAICFAAVLTIPAFTLSRLAGQAGRDHYNIAVGYSRKVVRSLNGNVISAHGSGMQKVERLRLRHPFDYVNHDNVGDDFFSDIVSRSCADIAGADYADFSPRHLAHLPFDRTTPLRAPEPRAAMLSHSETPHVLDRSIQR